MPPFKIGRIYKGDLWHGRHLLPWSLKVLSSEGAHTDKKENQIFLICKEIHNGAVANSYMTNGLLIYGEIFAHFLIYWDALPYL
jgi:hypothetical protein